MSAGWDYRTEYVKLLKELELETNSQWIFVDQQEPPQDGSELYFMCGKDYKGDTQYDFGKWTDYRNIYWHKISKEAGEDCLDGEWCTEFGNCEQIVAWRYRGEKK